MKTPNIKTLSVRHLGMQEYETIWRAMQQFTDQRSEQTIDEIWLLQHTPVFTQGQAGKKQHVLNPGLIPVIQVDRGGQVTYHGPGQVIAYLLLDIRRRKLGIRLLVESIEECLIELLKFYAIEAYGRVDAPGVYVDEAKIAALGLRVRKGCTFHGLSLNVQMDLEPFQRINPCGYIGLQVTQLSNLITQTNQNTLLTQVEEQLIHQLMAKLGYNTRFDFQTLPHQELNN